MSKLITEMSHDIQLFEENKNGKDNLYVVGIYSTAEVKNVNERRYKKDLLDREIKKLAEKKIVNKCCYGELNHPANPDVNPERAAILVENLEWKNNSVYGKSKVLSTPMGGIVKSILSDGGRLGISSRGLGTVGEDGWVNEDFNLITYDIVSNPSNHSSWINGIYEGVEFDTMNEAMKYAKRHYEDIAAIISGLDLPMNKKMDVINAFANAFEGDNPRFQREGFIRAARKGAVEEHGKGVVEFVNKLYKEVSK